MIRSSWRNAARAVRHCRPGHWLALAVGAFGALVLVGQYGSALAETPDRGAACAAAALPYRYDEGFPGYEFPFSSPCNAVDDLVPGWVNPVFALLAVVCGGAAVTAYVGRAARKRPVERVVRGPSGAMVAAAMVMVAVGALLYIGVLVVVVFLWAFDDAFSPGLWQTPPDTSTWSRIVLYGVLVLAVVADVAAGRGTYRAVLHRNLPASG